jgi:hypothetical protein
VVNNDNNLSNDKNQTVQPPKYAYTAKSAGVELFDFCNDKALTDTVLFVTLYDSVVIHVVEAML